MRALSLIHSFTPHARARTHTVSAALLLYAVLLEQLHDVLLAALRRES